MKLEISMILEPEFLSSNAQDFIEDVENKSENEENEIPEQ